MDEDFEEPHLDDASINDIKTDSNGYIFIEGRSYEIESYSKPEADGSRKATLREVAPF